MRIAFGIPNPCAAERSPPSGAYLEVVRPRLVTPGFMAIQV
jgi:hypothetical protein